MKTVSQGQSQSGTPGCKKMTSFFTVYKKTALRILQELLLPYVGTAIAQYRSCGDPVCTLTLDFGAAKITKVMQLLGTFSYFQRSAAL